MINPWYIFMFELPSVCTWKKDNIWRQLILIVFLTDVPKPVTTLVGRFLPVPAKVNLITQVSHVLTKQQQLGIIVLKFWWSRLEFLRKYNYPPFKGPQWTIYQVFSPVPTVTGLGGVGLSKTRLFVPLWNGLSSPGPSDHPPPVGWTCPWGPASALPPLGLESRPSSPSSVWWECFFKIYNRTIVCIY